ncbi:MULTISPECIES: hypothetical protein [Vibrio]|uniref:hypothetical protein n=1 Tax=Vibrio TaxID=662 RepID=UPI00207608DB|nr:MULTISPECIES: hypothetical protein [Vibrio]USD35573.1 hypothetical protein J8Z27_22435 [Vibrio sp. SCSIO 43186]USD72697.1 hypothetical protein J4N41_22450 [Vibrio sp. SCSIO 43139]USD98912.1 hypothetical protein CTT30_22785 [Vibrio coralliilyticus]
MLVECFKYDRWEQVNPLSLTPDDVYVHDGRTFVVEDTPFIDGSKLIIPGRSYEAGRHELAFGDRDMNFISMASDMVGSSAACFEDGTIMIGEIDSGITHVYSPRLPKRELNNFCERQMSRYQEFFDKHRLRIEDGERIAMERFW